MFRVVGFLLLVALLALGATWIADQGGDLVLTVGQWRVQTTPLVATLGFIVVLTACLLAWSILRALWRTPRRVRDSHRTRRDAKARHAITHGLIAIGHGDTSAARKHAQAARRLAANDPLALLLHAQSAQLDGDREGAADAFRQMAGRSDTRLLGLRGLFVEAQRADDPQAAVQIAEEALRVSPGVTWASQAVLGMRCAERDWSGALKLVERDFEAGVIDKKSYRRQRGVLLTARAMECESSDRDLARDSIQEAIKLAPTLVPAAVLAAKFHSEAHQTRRAMRIIEAAWLAHPHPDLAGAYAHVKLGDSARQRLARIESLTAKTPDHLESRIALARAAIDAQEFAVARDALAPLVSAPTQRVAMLMAEIERSEHGDTGRARAWMQRAVRALHDPVWTADGYVSDVWQPVSPVTGQLDAFRWQTPLASLPSGRSVDSMPDEATEIRLAPPSEPAGVELAMPPPAADATAHTVTASPAPRTEAGGEASIAKFKNEIESTLEAKSADQSEPEHDIKGNPETPPPDGENAAAPLPPPPLFRSRQDNAPLQKATRPAAPVIPIVRAPDDPGINEDEEPRDEFADQLGQPQRQSRGWKGFLHRWGA